MVAIKDVFPIRRGELKPALLMSTYFFLVIAVFWILKPLKKAMLATYYTNDLPFMLMGSSFVGGEVEQFAKILNMLIALVASILFTYLSRKFVKQALVLVVHFFFVLTLFAYAQLINSPSPSTVWTFYLYGDLWSTLNVALFFAFLNDLMNADQAKRLYGIIGLGGVLGGAVGSNFSGFFVTSMGAHQLLYAKAKPLPERNPEDNSDSVLSSMTEGARLVFGSKYLLAIMGIVAFYEIVSTIMDFQFTQGVLFKAQEFGWDRAAIGAYFGKVYGFTNVLAIFVQFFLTSFVMKRWGVGAALIVLPIAAVVSSFGFMIYPVLLTAASLSVVDNAFNYSINQSAKEALYVPTSQKIKYRAKGFIDIFIQRFAKTIGVVINLTIPALIGSSMTGVRWLSIASLLILSVWIMLAIYAGREFNRLCREQEKN